MVNKTAASISTGSLRITGWFWESGLSTEKRVLPEVPFFLSSQTSITVVPPSSFLMLNRTGRQKVIGHLLIFFKKVFIIIIIRYKSLFYTFHLEIVSKIFSIFAAEFQIGIKPRGKHGKGESFVCCAGDHPISERDSNEYHRTISPSGDTR